MMQTIGSQMVSQEASLSVSGAFVTTIDYYSNIQQVMNKFFNLLQLWQQRRCYVFCFCHFFQLYSFFDVFLLVFFLLNAIFNLF